MAAPLALPPNDLEAESAVLGAMLASPAALVVAAAMLTGSDFYKPSHGLLFDTLHEMSARDESVDVVTAAAVLERQGLLEQANGREYLHALVEFVPVIGNVGQYARRVKELARHREVIQGLQRAAHVAAAPDFDSGASKGVQRELEVLGQVLAGRDQGQTPVRIYDGSELAEMHFDQPEAICEGLFYRGCSTDMVADPKRGKTTLALSISRAIVAGEPWCGRPTRRAGVLYLTEQSPHSFNPQCRRAGLLGERRFCTLFHRDVLDIAWPQIGDLVLREAALRELGVVFIDNLSLWAGIAGEEENEAGVALQTLRVIEQLTGAGLAVQAIRHARKGGGSISEAGRGSSAIAGGFDVLVQVKGDKVPQRRVIEATGRVFASEPLPLIVELGADHRFSFVRDGRVAGGAEAASVVLALLPASPEDAIPEALIVSTCQAAGIGKPLTQKTLRALCEADDPEQCVSRAKGAGGASPQGFGYWRCSDA